MKLFKNLKLSCKSLTVHKIRTLLSFIGMTIGVAAVIVAMSVGKGAQREVLKQIEEMGTNLLIVNAGQVKIMGGRRRQAGRVTTLKLGDRESVARDCRFVSLTTPGQSRGLRVKYGNLSTMSTILGTTAEYRHIRNFPTTRGRYFTEDEDKAGLRLAVVGNRVVERLFENQDPIGETVRVSNIPFKIVGVLKQKGLTPDGADQDNQVLIPINTALRRVFNLDYLSQIYVQVKSRELMDAAAAEIRELLRERHRLNRRQKADDFTIQNQLIVLESEREATDLFTMMIAGIAALSLLVGGVGILATMLLSVKERISEIGLRMATGARPKDVLFQFLSEALILGMTGALAGTLVGVVGVLVVRHATQWQAVISPESIALSLSFSLSTALVFGVYPARRAALLDPIEALRSR